MVRINPDGRKEARAHSRTQIHRSHVVTTMSRSLAILYHTIFKTFNDPEGETFCKKLVEKEKNI